jgi:hypothetical protein
MLGNVLGIIFLDFVILFAICSCKVSSWADQKIENDIKERKQNEEKNI